jgi:hypothetical protein
MASLRRQLLPLLQQLPAQPSPDDCGRIAELLAETCRTRQQPRKALAVTLRHLGPALSPELHRLLSDLVSERLTVSRPAAPSATSEPTGRWLTMHETAAALNLHPNTLAERLRQRQYRRLYGWPIWDGHQWCFASAAVDPATAIAHLATLPTEEPTAVESMLPAWCERGEPTASESGCGTPGSCMEAEG